MLISFNVVYKTAPFRNLILEFAQVIPFNRSKVIKDAESNKMEHNVTVTKPQRFYNYKIYSCIV